MNALSSHRVDAIVLAAGRSSRMGPSNKLLALFDGEPLVRRTVRRCLETGSIGTVRIVLGHQHEAVAQALADLPVECLVNDAFTQGISTSIRLGFTASEDAAGVLVALADQPEVTSVHLNALVEAFRSHDGRAIVAASDRGRRRNPVILPARLAPEIASLTGDVGAAPILKAYADKIVTVEIGASASLDVDTPEALLQAGGVPSGKTSREA